MIDQDQTRADLEAAAEWLHICADGVGDDPLRDIVRRIDRAIAIAQVVRVRLQQPVRVEVGA